MASEKSDKPLGGRAYGSIPHLPGSRLGQGEHRITEGQCRICTVKARDRHDEILVQEKVDGSNVAVARLDGQIVPVTRAGYRAISARFEQHRLFAQWVFENQERFAAVLRDGERLCGEWLAQAHGTRYDLPHEPLVVFDLMVGPERRPYDKFQERVAPGRFVVPRLIHRGTPISIEEVRASLEPSGHGAIDPVEGAVWRVQRRGKVDFLAKWVRPDKIDGLYLPEVSGRPAVWNWRPDPQRRGRYGKPGGQPAARRAGDGRYGVRRLDGLARWTGSLQGGNAWPCSRLVQLEATPVKL